MIRDREGQGGFTLAELLVAGLLLILALHSLAMLFMSTLALNAASRDRTLAANLAQERMDLLLMNSYESLVPGGDLVTPMPDYHEMVDTDKDGTADFSVLWHITLAPSIGECKQVSVRVRTIRGTSRPDNPQRTVTLATYVADIGR